MQYAALKTKIFLFFKAQPCNFMPFYNLHQLNWKIFTKTSVGVAARLETKGHVAQGMQIFTHYQFQSHE
jgi:hypothetical protein